MLFSEERGDSILNSDSEISNKLRFPLSKPECRKDVCVRCGKTTVYDESVPIEQRKHYIEGSGQLCVECWQILYGEE